MIVVFVVMDPIVKIDIHEKFSVKIISVDFVPKDHVVHCHIQHSNCRIRMNMRPCNERLFLFVIIVMKQDIKHHHVSNCLMKNDRNMPIHQRTILKDNILIIDRIIIMMEVNSMINTNNYLRHLLNLFNMMLLVTNVVNEGLLRCFFYLFLNNHIFLFRHYANKCTRPHVPYMRNQNMQRR